MRWLSNFWKIRKQNDYVKIMLILVLLGTGMLGNAITNGVNLYHSTLKPMEYILTGNVTGGINKSQMEEIIEIENVAAASVQTESVLTVKSNENDIVWNCYELSDSYFEEAYKISGSKAMRTFYLTPKAFERLSKSTENLKKTGIYKLHMDYMLGEEESGIGQFVLLENEMFSDEEYAFYQGSDADLSESNQIRVYAEKQDITGITIKSLENLGYEITNSEEVLRAGFQQTKKMIGIKYSIFIGILCFLFVVILKKALFQR